MFFQRGQPELRTAQSDPRAGVPPPFLPPSVPLLLLLASLDVTDGEERTTQKWGEIEGKKKKETDKVSRGKQREDDLNRQTGGSLTPRKLFFPDAGSVVVVVVAHLHIEGVLSKRPLAWRAGGGGGRGGIGSKSREDDRG